MIKMKNNKRDLNIDRYRGLYVLLMIIFGLLSSFTSFGALQDAVEHAPDTFPKTQEEIEYQNDNHPIYLLPNLAIADFSPGPFFLLISYSLIPSYERKIKKYGKKKALQLTAGRYIAFIGIGACTYTICSLMYGYLFNKLAFPLIILTAFVILLLVAYLLSLLFKIKTNLTAKIKELLKYTILFMGIYNIALDLLNTILVILGYTEEFFGYWGVLEHIGITGLITIFIISKLKSNSSKERLVLGIIIMIAYTIFHESTLPTLINNSIVDNNMRIIDLFPDGGILGGIGYTSMLLILTYIMDMYKTNKKKYYLSIFTLGICYIIIATYSINTFVPWNKGSSVLSAGLSPHFTLSKCSISPTYIVVHLFTTLVIFALVCLLNKIKIKYDLLNMLGRNGILLFILEFIFIQTFGFLTRDVPLIIAILESITISLLLFFIAYKLYKKDIIIKI